MSGVWVIVDNGCHDWSVTVPPLKQCRTHPERRWAKWVEGLRKDVEMTFGTLKGRFRVLKNGIRVKGPGKTDNIWLTCCALHNFLLREDSLDSPWDSALALDTWLEPRFADHSDEDLVRSFRDLDKVSDAHRKLDTTGVGEQIPSWSTNNNQLVADDEEQPECEHEPHRHDPAGEEGPEGSTPVNSLSLSLLDFCSRLIEHFDILFSRQEIKWPKQSGLGSEPTVNVPKAWRALHGTVQE